MTSRVSYNGTSFEPEEEFSYLEFPDQRDLGKVKGQESNTVDISEAYSKYMSEPLDASDMSSITKRLINARKALAINHLKQVDVEERLSLAKSKFDTEYQKALIVIEGGTAKEREAVASLNTHPLYEDVRVLNGVMSNLNLTARLIRTDIEILISLSHNVRQEQRAGMIGATY